MSTKNNLIRIYMVGTRGHRLEDAIEEALINASVLAFLCVEGFGTDAIIAADKTEIILRRTYLQDRIR